MMEIIAWGTLFFIIGFGLGRLNFHFLSLNSQKQTKPSTLVDSAHLTQGVTAWAALYTQSTSLHNEMVKLASTVSLATLGVTATLIANKKIAFLTIGEFSERLLDNKSWDWSAYGGLLTIIALLLALLVALLATENLAHKQRDLANEIARQFNNNLPSKLPRSDTTKRYFLSLLAAFLFITFAIYSLLSAVSTSFHLAEHASEQHSTQHNIVK